MIPYPFLISMKHSGGVKVNTTGSAVFVLVIHNMLYPFIRHPNYVIFIHSSYIQCYIHSFTILTIFYSFNRHSIYVKTINSPSKHIIPIHVSSSIQPFVFQTMLYTFVRHSTILCPFIRYPTMLYPLIRHPNHVTIIHSSSKPYCISLQSSYKTCYNYTLNHHQI